MVTLPDSIWATYREFADFFIDEFGSSCTLIYPPKRETCNNCTINPFGGGSTNVYRHGGPAPFQGRCPICGGNGFRESENTDTITLRLYWRAKDWIKVANNINVPDADVQVIGYLSDLYKLKMSTEIRLINNDHGRWNTVLAGEPFPHGFKKDRYFVAFLKRI